LKRSPGCSAIPDLPPDLNVTPVNSITLRYQATAAVTGTNITVGYLLAACGNICTVANTTLESIASSVRVRRVTIWPAASSTSSPGYNQANLAWVLSSTSKDDSRISVLPDGVTASKCVSSRPPRGTLAGMWHTNNDNSLAVLIIACSAGSVIDVQLQFTCQNIFGGVATSVASGTQGDFYYTYLDSTSGHLLAPIGRPRTF